MKTLNQCLIILFGISLTGSLFGEIPRTITIPTCPYTAYDIPEGGSELRLYIVPANDYAIDVSDIYLKDESDAVQWECAGGHTYRIGTVFSSREYLWVTGLYHKVTGGGGSGPHPKFDAKVNAVDVDVSGAPLEANEETVGVWIGKGGARKAVSISAVKCKGPNNQQALTWSSAKLSLWPTASGGTPLPGGSKSLTANYTTNFYVQGDMASSSIRDSEIAMSYSDSVSGESSHDWVKLTVVGATISPFSTVLVNATNDVSVTLSPNPPGITNTLQIVCLNGSGSAVFMPSGSTSSNIAQSGTVKIKGLTASSVTNNMMLKAMLGSDVLASNVFTVIEPEVNLSANDLYGTVAEADEATIGAYIHWNLDNDDASDNTVGAPKHSGGDYLQTNATQVAGENDLKSLAMSLQPDLNQGSVVLNINNAKGKVWKAQTKGSANLVLAGSGDKTWDLANSSQKADFQSLCSNLWMEGNDAGTCNIKLTYKDTSGAELCSDTVKYTFIAADCGRQPKTDSPNERSDAQSTFPNIVHCEWSATAEATSLYNCIAYSVGITNKWIGQIGP